VDNLTERPSSNSIHGWTALGAGSATHSNNLSLYQSPLHGDGPYFEPLARNIYIFKGLGQAPQCVNAYLGRSPRAAAQLIAYTTIGHALPLSREQSSLTNSVDEPSDMANTVEPWFARAFERLQELMLLPPDWDGEEGRAVTPRVAAATFDLLDRLAGRTALEPSLVPTREGRLQLEWHEPTGHIEAEVDENSSVHIWYHDLLSDEEREDTAPSMRAAISEIDALVAVLESRE